MPNSESPKPPDWKDDFFDVKAFTDEIRKRAKKAVRKKSEYGVNDPDLDRREPHPFDE